MHAYIRSDSVVSRVIAGETLIVPVRKGVGDLSSIYSLSEVASSIWQALGAPRSKSEIVQWIEEEFDADRQQIEQDVSSFLAEMCSVGLVREMGASI
ncbi:MAG: PqqD family protein [Acidobacteria bacterium]|nr:PqqD family protein [Acidobacteriota bacterium]